MAPKLPMTKSRRHPSIIGPAGPDLNITGLVLATLLLHPQATLGLRLFGGKDLRKLAAGERRLYGHVRIGPTAGGWVGLSAFVVVIPNFKTYLFR